jgi:hypothetical protein
MRSPSVSIVVDARPERWGSAHRSLHARRTRRRSTLEFREKAVRAARRTAAAKGISVSLLGSFLLFRGATTSLSDPLSMKLVLRLIGSDPHLLGRQLPRLAERVGQHRPRTELQQDPHNLSVATYHGAPQRRAPDVARGRVDVDSVRCQPAQRAHVAVHCGRVRRTHPGVSLGEILAHMQRLGVVLFGKGVKVAGLDGADQERSATNVEFSPLPRLVIEAVGARSAVGAFLHQRRV